MEREIERQAIEEDEIDLRELFLTIKKNQLIVYVVTIVATLLTLVYVLSLPNSYKSEAILVPQQQQQPKLGGLGALAGLAGVDIGGMGGGSELGAKESYELLLHDYRYMRDFILKNRLWEMGSPEHFIFAKDFRLIYDLVHSDKRSDFESLSDEQKEALLFGTYRALSSIITLNENKDGTITLSAEDQDRFFAKKLVSLFLSDASSRLVNENKRYIEKQLRYYEERLARTHDISLKTQIATLMSTLIQQGVFAESSDYYKVRLLFAPEVAYIHDKTKPKRGLILVVSFITALILSIFMIFLKEFISGSNREVVEKP